MHLYFQSAHEEHQMGLVQIIIQFVKSAICTASPHCEATWPSQKKALAPLHNKVDLFEDLLGAVVILQLTIIVKDTTSHHNFGSLINMCIDANARSSTYF
jgi:hypothetical protein